MIKRNESGLILVLVMVMVSALMLIGISLISQATSQHTLTSATSVSANALYTAEAGIEQSVQQLNASSSFSGYGSPQVFFNTESQGYGVYTSSITPASGNSNAKVITSTGKIYRHRDHTKLVSERTVQVTVVGTTSQGYSLMTGAGGLVLRGSANVTNSSVYVGGKISLVGAASIGTNAKPLDVKVANKACPAGNNPGASYPALCTSTQPISLDWSTNIYGSVCATGQTSKGPNNNIKTGSGGQGLIVGCTAPEVEQPSFDKNAHIAGMTTTGAGNNNTYVCNSWPFDRVWPAGLKLTGDVNISGSCNVTIKGNVYITGKLTIGGAATVRVDSSAGANRPVIVADGKVTVDNSAAIIANNAGTGVHFISMASNAPCGSNCTSITGTALKNTSTYETVFVGGAVSVPGVVFQAYWGQATITGSGNVGSAIGQTVDLSGAGTITFGTVLSSGVSTWTISSYQIRYPRDL
jgi:hypothetical protein